MENTAFFLLLFLLFFKSKAFKRILRFCNNLFLIITFHKLNWRMTSRLLRTCHPLHIHKINLIQSFTCIPIGQLNNLVDAVFSIDSIWELRLLFGKVSNNFLHFPLSIRIQLNGADIRQRVDSFLSRALSKNIKRTVNLRVQDKYYFVLVLLRQIVKLPSELQKVLCVAELEGFNGKIFENQYFNISGINFFGHFLCYYFAEVDPSTFRFRFLVVLLIWSHKFMGNFVFFHKACDQYAFSWTRGAKDEQNVVFHILQKISHKL